MVHIHLQLCPSWSPILALCFPHLLLQRVTEVYHQLESEVQDPLLPAAAASELVVHMAQLQAEGLAAAAGADPLALLLGAREAQFTATMQVGMLGGLPNGCISFDYGCTMPNALTLYQSHLGMQQ